MDVSNIDASELSSKLESRDKAYHEVIKLMETSINNVKTPKDKFRTQEFLEEIKKDLNMVMSLHYGQANLRVGYTHARKQNDKLYKENLALKAELKEKEE